MIHRTVPTYVGIQLAIATAIPCAAGWCAGRAYGADGAPPPTPTAYADTYVDDSFEVRELLSELATLARRGRWVDASQLVQRIFDLHADRLVQVDAGLYEGVVETLNRVVAQWPKDGLAAYRALFDQAAQDRFEAARRRPDIDALLAILDRYFCTSVGVSIAEATCDLALESADFALAEDACKRVLESHPDRASVADRFAGRLALIAALTGDVVKAERWVSVHRGGADEAVIHWMGRAEPLVPLLQTIASDPVVTEHSEGEFFWPVFGGDMRRNGEGTFQFGPIVQLWRFDEFPSGSLGLQAGPSESASLRRAIEAGKYLVFNPVAGLGLIFFQDADDVWALQGSSGTLVWHFRGGEDDASRFASGDGSLPEWYSPTLEADRLYVCLGGESVPYYGYEVRGNVSALLCLDARTGQLQWRADRLRFGDSLAKMRFDASPLVQNGRVYVVGRRRRTFGFEDCYLLQFRASDGALLHQTHLGSASTGGFGYRRATRSIPALADNTVYVNTQLGTIAAVSARTGRVRWLRLYEREPEAEWRQSIRSSSREIVPWHYNPTICSSKWVVCRPSDAPRVLVIDRQDGRIVHDVHTADLKDMETLLAVRDGTLYGIGENVFAFDLDSARMIWSQPLPDDARLYGRGTVASGRIIIPTNKYLCAYDLHDGARSQIPWASGEEGGNLLGIADQLVVAGYDHISVYGRKKDVWDRLHRLMTQSPNDPEPALDLAELAFRSGDLDQAAEVFDQAIQRAGGFVGLTDEAIRSRIFQDCLRFAKAWPKDREALRERVERLYEYAAQCAPDTTAHVVYRFQFAEYLSRQSQPERAVIVYQQILADRSLRDAVGVGELPGGETAGLAAQKRIHELIAEHGRGVYAPFDAEATSWLNAARASRDTALLDRILETHPTAAVCADAMMLKGQLLRERGEPEQAARTYYAVYNRTRTGPDAADPPRLMRLIADCYAEAGRPKYAWLWLTKAAREYPQAKVEVSGRMVRLIEYREAFDFARDQVEVRYPQVHLPLKERYERTFERPAELLDPILPPAPDSDWSRTYVYSNAQLFALASQTGAPVWDEPAPCHAQPELLVATSRRVALATRHEVFGLDAETGRRIWSWGRYPADLAEPGADPEWFVTLYAHAYDAGRLFCLQDDGKAACLDIETGKVHWEHALVYRPTSPPVVFDRWLVFQGSADRGRRVYCVLNAESGELIRAIDPGAESHPLRLHVTLDDKLIAVLSRSVQAYDLTTGRLLWQVERDENITDSTIQFDLDGIYLSDATEHVEKLSYDAGSLIWRSEPLIAHPARNIQAFPEAGQVIYVSDRGLVAIDPVDGRTLWETSSPPEVTLRGWRRGRSIIAAIGTAPERDGKTYTAFLYNHERGTLIGEDGIVELGALGEVRRITLRDDAIVLQLGNHTISGWAAR